MIASTQNDTIKRYAKLHQKKHRDKEGLFIVEGLHLVEEAEKHGLIHKVFSLQREADTVHVNESVMKKLTQTHHVPPIAAVVKTPVQKPLSNRVLIMEHIQDPGNVGTLIRTALAFGFKTIVLDRSADIYSAKVLRSTQGAIFQMAIRFMDVSTFKTINPHYTLVAADISGDEALTPPDSPFALVLGNEGQGLEASTLTLCERRVRIAIEHIDSLNVAIAGGILMHRLK